MTALNMQTKKKKKQQDGLGEQNKSKNTLEQKKKKTEKPIRNEAARETVSGTNTTDKEA